MEKTLSNEKDFQVGDVIWVNLNPTRGAEKKKTRPCLVIQKKITSLDLLTVLPITDARQNRKGPFFINIHDLLKAGLNKKSVIDCYQIRTIALERINNQVGSVSESVINEVKASLALILNIYLEHINVY